jgi:hypothetical protein
METMDILKLITAIVLGYAIMVITMWLFRDKSKDKKKKKK